MKNPNRGFIALISVIIIAAILLMIVTAAGMANFFARSDSLGRENSVEAHLLAESCMQVALLQLASSSSYSPTDRTFDIGTDPAGNKETCTIQSIVRTGSGLTISTYGTYNNSYQPISFTKD